MRMEADLPGVEIADVIADDAPATRPCVVPVRLTLVERDLLAAIAASRGVTLEELIREAAGLVGDVAAVQAIRRLQGAPPERGA